MEGLLVPFSSSNWFHKPFPLMPRGPDITELMESQHIGLSGRTEPTFAPGPPCRTEHKAGPWPGISPAPWCRFCGDAGTEALAMMEGVGGEYYWWRKVLDWALTSPQHKASIGRDKERLPTLSAAPCLPSDLEDLL